MSSLNFKKDSFYKNVQQTLIVIFCFYFSTTTLAMEQDTSESIEQQNNSEQGEEDFQKGIAFYKAAKEEINQNNKEELYKKAIGFFMIAAEANHLKALYNLGLMYDNGEGVEQSHDMALGYYMAAADLGNIDAQATFDQINSNNRENDIWSLLVKEQSQIELEEDFQRNATFHSTTEKASNQTKKEDPSLFQKFKNAWLNR